MAAAFLSDEWFALARDEAAALPPSPGASLVMQHIVTGAPQGKLQVVVEIRDGQLAELGIGKRADAACTLSWAYADALAALHGEVPIDVAFMRGDLKVEGDYIALLFGLRPVFADDGPGAKVLEAIRAATEG